LPEEIAAFQDEEFQDEDVPVNPVANGQWKTLGFSEGQWEQFEDNIRMYLRYVPVIHPKLFSHFVDHEDPHVGLIELANDVSREMTGMAWGGFKGLSDEFRMKYDFTEDDEFVLLEKYLPIRHYGRHSYQRLYAGVVQAVRERDETERANEVDETLRDGILMTATERQVMRLELGQQVDVSWVDELHSLLDFSKVYEVAEGADLRTLEVLVREYYPQIVPIDLH